MSGGFYTSDRGGICGRGVEHMEKCYWVRHVNWSDYNIVRGGVVVYTIINNHVFICLGVDKKHKELTDFGGGVKATDGSPLMGAIREFREESKDVFGEENYKPEAFLDSPCLIKRDPFKNRNDTYHMMIIFQEVDPSYLSNAMSTFADQDVTSKDEVSAIVWCSEVMFRNMIYTQENTRMYSRVRKFISSCISFNKLLYTLKLRSSLAKNNPNFGESLILKHSGDIHQPWVDEPQAAFRRRRVYERRPRFNFSNYTYSNQN